MAHSPSIARTLLHALDLGPDRLAVVDGERRFSYGQLAQRAAALARYLAAQGLRPGDRVSILDVNSHRFLEAYYAAALAGLILNPLNHRLAAPELGAILGDAGARFLLAGPGFEAQAGALRDLDTPLQGALLAGDYDAALAAHGGEPSLAVVAPDDVAQLYYTSGTTGTPKGVMLTHANVLAHSAGAIAELRLCGDDVWGHIAPMFHLADAWACFAITRVGGVHVMLPRFEAEAALRAIEAQRITISNLIPTMLNLMVKHPRVDDFDRSSLRAILSGGAPIAPEVVRQIVETFGCEYVQTYGLTETSPYLTMSLLHEHLRGLPAEQRLRVQARTGRPCRFVELRVVDEAGADVRADDASVGEVWARGPSVTPGYWHRPDATAAAFAPGGWLKTGDLAVVDGEGYLDIVDRKTGGPEFKPGGAMKIVFHEDYHKVYTGDPAAARGRLKPVARVLRQQGYAFVEPDPVELEAVLRVHDEFQVQRIRKERKVGPMALLAAGGALRAAEIALSGEPAFALLRPPGHHASADSCWGFRFFNNMAGAAVALCEGLLAE